MGNFNRSCPFLKQTEIQIVKERIEGGANEKAVLRLFINCPVFGGNKFFCNHLCGRGQLFSKLGGDLKCSRNKPTPQWMSSKWFRYGFLIFFLTMFGNMVFQTYLVGGGASSLHEAIKLFWTFRVPWGRTYMWRAWM